MKNKLQIFVTLVFLGFAVWWVTFQHVVAQQGPSVQWFGGTYGVVALMGAIIGFMAARKWGGRKTVLGKALLLFSQPFCPRSGPTDIYLLHIRCENPDSLSLVGGCRLFRQRFAIYLGGLLFGENGWAQVFPQERQVQGDSRSSASHSSQRLIRCSAVPPPLRHFQAADRVPRCRLSYRRGHLYINRYCGVSAV